MSVSKVQNIVTHVSSLQTQQTLVADHFMVPQALEILCQLPWHQTGTRSQRQVKFRLRWDSSEGEVKSGVWDTNTHLRVTEDRKITFCFVCFFLTQSKLPIHVTLTQHDIKTNTHTHTHKKIHIYTFKSLPSQQCMNIEIVYTASVENLVDQVHTSVNDMFWRLVAANKIRGNFIINCGMLYYENLLI